MRERAKRGGALSLTPRIGYLPPFIASWTDLDTRVLSAQKRHWARLSEDRVRAGLSSQECFESDYRSTSPTLFKSFAAVVTLSVGLRKEVRDVAHLHLFVLHHIIDLDGTEWTLCCDHVSASR